jgi:dimethylargininase
LRFERAIVRPPAENFADGLTTADLGTPDWQTAVAQHERYCEALETCGLALSRLPAEPRYPDSTFVEDAAVVTRGLGVVTRPGAPSRAGEIETIREALAPFFPALCAIEPPGTVDGGDICEAGDRFLIGVSRRTNEEGAQQLADLLRETGREAVLVDLRDAPDILHLKSGIAYLGGNRLVAIESLAGREELRTFERVIVPTGEEYAANCLPVNDRLLVPAGFPGLEAKLRGLGHATHALEMSEFQKMDGGLSCLSLRF